VSEEKSVRKVLRRISPAFFRPGGGREGGREDGRAGGGEEGKECEEGFPVD